MVEMGLLCIFLVSYITASSLEEVELWASASDYAGCYLQNRKSQYLHPQYLPRACCRVLVALSSFCD